MKKKQFRILASCFVLLIVFVAFLASLSEESITYYHTASDVIKDPAKFSDEKIRVMGLVKEGSVNWDEQAGVLSFQVTDDLETYLSVSYKGIKPDMFREGQGVVAQGTMEAGVLVSDQLLVKHTEEYKKTGDGRMPPDMIIKSLEAQGGI